MRYVFGPVPSRRLGRSLGVDLVPFKTCSYDCIYCQLGRTTNKTIERREWAPLDAVLDEIKRKLPSNPDYITLSGSGEPTLYARLGELIEGVRSLTHIPIAVLTNGSLLWIEDVRRELLGAHTLVPSLDAGSAPMFETVNRPHPEVTFERMLSGLLSLRREYRGRILLEVLLVGGYTADEFEVGLIRECASAVRPDRVQLNTVARPPAESSAAPVPRVRLERFAESFSPRAEVICHFHGVHSQSDFAANGKTVLEMLQRRPCTLSDIARGLGIHRNEAAKYLEQLISTGRAETVRSEQHVYYRSVTGALEHALGERGL